MFDLEGVILSDYYLLQCISKGGVADVYRARHNEEPGYEVAVKIFRPGYAQKASFREYFMEEAERIGQFEHPNILPFLEFGEGEGLLYVVTPYVSTGTLEDLLKRVGGKFSAMQALPIIEQLASAIQYAHDRDIIHGNIKPSNVCVGADGRMLLADFGIARGYDDSQQSLTRIGWGSAEYASPEQSLGVLRRSSDIYSLGVLLFRILTGQPPFSGQTPVEVLLKHVRQQAPSARSLAPNISDAVDGVLSMAMQKRSDDRFASAIEFSNAYAAAVTVAPVASPVARTIPPVQQQEVVEQVMVTNPGTPTPLYQSQSSLAVPETPVPASTARYPSVPLTPPKELSPAARQAQQPLQQKPSSALKDGAEISSHDITEPRKKSFLEERDKTGKYIFWSVDPVEWSPIGEERGGRPSTAREYIEDLPTRPEPPSAKAPALPPKAKAAPEPIKLNNEKKEKKASPLRAKVNKILPVVVVVLLILFLLGALLSSFFFSNGGSKTNQTLPLPLVRIESVAQAPGRVV